MKISDLALVFQHESSIWLANKTDRSTTDEIILLKRADKKSGKFTKNLFAGHCLELKAIQNHTQSFNNWIKSNTLPYGRGTRLVPMKDIVGLINKVQVVQAEFYQLVETFLEQYESLIDNARSDLDLLFEENLYPPKEVVRKKFDFSYSLSPIPSSNQFDNRLGTKELEEQLSKEFEDNMNERFEKAENILKMRLAKKINHVINAFRQYSEDQKNGRVLGVRTLNAIVETAKTIKSLNLRGNTELNNWCDRTVTAFGFDSVHYRSNLVSRLNVIEILSRIFNEIGIDENKLVDEEVAV